MRPITDEDLNDRGTSRPQIRFVFDQHPTSAAFIMPVHLPLEISHDIIRLFSLKIKDNWTSAEAGALATLARTCTAFSPVAQNELYHTFTPNILISLGSSVKPTSATVKAVMRRYFKYMRTIKCSPHLGRLVIGVYGDMSVYKYKWVDTSYSASAYVEPDPFWRMMQGALSNMPNLQLFVVDDIAPSDSFNLFAPLSMPNLSVFSFPTSSYSVIRGITSFLRRHPHI